MNDLKTIESAIQRLETMLDINKDYMDADDQGNLQVTIDDLKHMARKIKYNNYIDQVKQFVDYMQTTLTDEDEQEEWLNTPYVITQGNHSVTIDNDADFYEGLLSLLKEHLSIYLE